MPLVASLQHWPTLFRSEEYLPLLCMHSSNPAELSLFPDFLLDALCPHTEEVLQSLRTC